MRDMHIQNDLLVEVEAYVRRFFDECISKDYVYHDFEHTQDVVRAVEEIGLPYQLSEREMENLKLAAWFHDTGYDRGAEQHEERSCDHARAFLQKYDFPEEDLKTVLRCIRATKMEVEPQTLLEKILCDADMSHLGNRTYWQRCGRVRQELNLTQDHLMSDREWVEFELRFITSHQFYTNAARELLQARKDKHIEQLRKHRRRLFPELAERYENEHKNGEEKKKKKKKNKNKDADLKELNLGRGVETMYRTTYRTHINLSSIADNKANIMLSINAIIISIVVSSLVPRFGDMPRLIIPTMILLAVCLTALVFAILSTRPKVTQGVFTREDIEQKQSNLLFFGNFYNMDLDDFHWGMMEMIKDRDFLYSSMTRDLYYLGIVLAQKYRYLRICYGIFMYGIITAVIAFALSFLLFDGQAIG